MSTSLDCLLNVWFCISIIPDSAVCKCKVSKTNWALCVSFNQIIHNHQTSSSISLTSLSGFKTLIISLGVEVFINTTRRDALRIESCRTMYTASCALILTLSHYLLPISLTCCIWWNWSFLLRYKPVVTVHSYLSEPLKYNLLCTQHMYTHVI